MTRRCRLHCHNPFLVLLFTTLLCAACTATSLDERQYVLIGVSGTLQDGFPLRDRLDFHPGLEDESRAIFLGRSLVRGYKAYLDIKQEGWREYVPEPGLPPVNHVVLPSGCHEHANVYWVYAVDSRQVLDVLMGEPRFLSISPDTGLLDLSAHETSQNVKLFARHEIIRQGKTDMDHVAIPLVTAVWYHDSYVPSPPMYVQDDGSEVTSFEGSLALWARVSDRDRTMTKNDCHKSTEPECIADAQSPQERYWDGIRQAVRNAEKNRQSQKEIEANGPPFRCKGFTRFGVGPETARINNPFTYKEIRETMDAVGFEISDE